MTKSRSIRETHDRYLRDPEFAIEYINDALEEGDIAEVLLALKNVSQAHQGGVAAVARDAGLSRPSLYKALAEDGNPKFSTIQKVIEAVGLRLRVVPAYQLHDHNSNNHIAQPQ